MKITNVTISNFRLLKDIQLSFEPDSTVIVGRNNSGKTSLTEVFRRLLSEKPPVFSMYDFNISCIEQFKRCLDMKAEGIEEKDIRAALPEIKISLRIKYDLATKDLSILSDFIIDLNPECNEVLISLQYQLEAGKIKQLFDEIEGNSDKVKTQFIKTLKDRIPSLYKTVIYAIDPHDDTNRADIEFSSFKRLISAGFINAQRGLDDVTTAEKDVLGKVLGKLFKTANNGTAPADFKEKSEAVIQVMNDLQTTVDTKFNDSLNKLLPALKLFGYPGLSDSEFSTETTLNIASILESQTKIRYSHGSDVYLPETYNGLGSRNLIYILFQLFEFFRNWQSQPVSSGLCLVFIEEPEAHLHPQMQQVFIKQLTSIAEKFASTLNDNIPWPVQFIVTTHSTHIANEANFNSIRYFLTNRNQQVETKIKDLRHEFKSDEVATDRDFLHKYLTLTKCDLFFADKAIMIEGPTERILMPVIIELVDEGLPEKEKLKGQYLSVVEIGGAYAHHFYKFLDFLELRTLIITDIDAVVKTKGEKKTSYPAIKASAGSHSTNAGIKNWFDKGGEGYIELDKFQKVSSDEKISGCRRIAFQIPEKDKKYRGRSFEDAFMLANLEIFEIKGATEEENETLAYDMADDIDKTDFALKYALTDTAWIPPLYIKEGLEWLAAHPNVVIEKVEAAMVEVQAVALAEVAEAAEEAGPAIIGESFKLDEK